MARLPEAIGLRQFSSRRAFLLRASALGAAAFLEARAARAAPEPRFRADPFSLGVASGAPRPDGVVIWTRLAPEPLAGGGMEPSPVEVRWEVADDSSFRKIVRRGTAIAFPKRAHSVHVEVEGLEPAREYFYRFTCRAAVSPQGRTRTAPVAGNGDGRLRLAFGSCQQYEQGYYVAHRHLAAEAPDLVAFLGDYIYESSWGSDHVRSYGAGEPRTLAEYRTRYAVHKSDPDLQACHAAVPWIVTWDDHEVANDYANDRPETPEPAFLDRRAAAYRAFLEHLPIRPSVVEADGAIRLYDRHAWGGLALIHVLDDRQYRSYQVCVPPGRGGSSWVSADCMDRLDPNLTMLGPAQEAWLDEGFAASKARWNVIAQQTLLAPAGWPGRNGVRVHWTDGWDGYPAARERLLGSMDDRRLANPVVISGDVHANYVADLNVAPSNPRSRVVATEFCGTSITSQGPDPKRVQAIYDGNSHLRFAEATLRGYTLLDFTPGRMEARLRTVETVKRKDAAVATRATFFVEDGKPGAQK